MERSDDEFESPTSSKNEPLKAIDKKLTQIDSTITELKQIIENNQTHFNSIIYDQFPDTQDHITSTDNADVETKSENENISVDVNDFKLEPTSESVLTQGDASNDVSIFNLDHFLSSQQTIIMEPFAKPEMSTNDAENASITTPNNTQTANDSESYNLCDFSIESEPSLIAQDIASTLESTDESTIKQERDTSVSAIDDQIDDKLIDDAKDQNKEYGQGMVSDSIEG